MAKEGTVVIHEERCKGCGLCVALCPVNVLDMAEETNARGYHFPLLARTGCVGCEICARMCPDFVFEVFQKVPAGAR